MKASSSHLVRSTVIVGGGTGLSRALGFVREMLMAAFFGTSLAQSAFVVAFRIPNLFRRLFGEGALSSAFIPVFTESLEKEGHDKAWQLAGRVMAMLGTLLAAIVLSGIVIISLVVRSADTGGMTGLVLDLLRIMLPYMFFICLVALCMGILNSFHHFVLPAYTPVLLNVFWIGTLVLICPRFGDTTTQRIYGVAWGVLVAGVVQLAVQAPMLVRYGFRGRLSLRWTADRRVHRILALMGPAALGMGITQVNVFVDTMLAAWIGTWAPAALSFSERLIYLPLGIFATALGTVLLPVFSGQVARSEPQEIKRTLNGALKSILLIMTPAATGLLVLARPIVELVFERGEFTEFSTTLTSRALMFYAPGLLVFSLYKVLVPVFYAMQDTRTPVRVALRVLLLNVVLNITFLLTWPLHFKHAGLALATVLASVVSVLALGWLLHRRIGSPGWKQVLHTALRAVIASAIMGAASVAVHSALAAAFSSGGAPVLTARLVSVAAAIAAGIVVYAVLAFLLCRNECRAVLSTLLSRKRGDAS